MDASTPSESDARQISDKLTDADEERYAQAADWAESVEGLPAAAKILDATIARDGRELVEELSRRVPIG
ncbi:hypothetical protein [Diaminobutyricibacter sp. McL0608]|uniref:hypothetical protein n=1 Tax=Leifsonia sp. McL0608 TaxID=3143537 RepID=UPI0031F3239D